jgi:hypothetical protein
MAKVYLVRDGSGEGHTSRAYSVLIEKVTDALSEFAVRFYKNGPVINADVPFSNASPYKHVVLEVEEGEESAGFRTVGFYLIVGLGVRECASLFSLYY